MQNLGIDFENMEKHEEDEIQIDIKGGERTGTDPSST